MKRIIKNVVESSICNRLGRIVRLNSGNLTSVIFIFGSLFRSKPFFLCALCHWYQKMWNFMHTPTQMLKSRFSMFNLHEKGSSLVSLVLFLNDFRSFTIWAFQIQISFPGVEIATNPGIQLTYSLPSLCVSGKEPSVSLGKISK